MQKRLGEPDLQPNALKRAYVDFHENDQLAIKDLQAVLRHSNAQMSLQYARADEGAQREMEAQNDVPKARSR